MKRFVCGEHTSPGRTRTQGCVLFSSGGRHSVITGPPALELEAQGCCPQNQQPFYRIEEH